MILKLNLTSMSLFLSMSSMDGILPGIHGAADRAGEPVAVPGGSVHVHGLGPQGDVGCDVILGVANLHGQSLRDVGATSENVERRFCG